ncbi:MAG: multidrug effflux MFS transporter [Alphaproteobacteria bacterium]
MPILQENKFSINPTILFWMLVFMSGLGPFSLQIFLPALQDIASDFRVEFAEAQFALSLSMIAIAIGMLVTGPLADHYGRRPIVILGTILFLIGSLICLMSWDLTSLITGRIIQAFGGAAGVVIARAVLRDLYADSQNARAMSFVVVAMVVGPGLAPLAGVALTEWNGWRTVFVPPLVIGLLTLLAVYTRLPETKNSTKTSESSKLGLVASWKVLFSSRTFNYLNLVSACSISVFYSVVSGASYAVQNFMNGKPEDYGFLLIGMSASFISGNLISGNLVVKFGTVRLMRFGLILGLAVTIFIFALTAMDINNKLLLLLGCMVFALSNGFVVANTQSAAINDVPSVAGKASGLLGFSQMIMSAVVVQLVAYFLHIGPIAISISMVISASLAMLLFILAKVPDDKTA